MKPLTGASLELSYTPAPWSIIWTSLCSFCLSIQSPQLCKSLILFPSIRRNYDDFWVFVILDMWSFVQAFNFPFPPEALKWMSQFGETAACLRNMLCNTQIKKSVSSHLRSPKEENQLSPGGQNSHLQCKNLSFFSNRLQNALSSEKLRQRDELKFLVLVSVHVLMLFSIHDWYPFRIWIRVIWIMRSVNIFEARSEVWIVKRIIWTHFSVTSFSIC